MTQLCLHKTCFDYIIYINTHQQSFPHILGTMDLLQVEKDNYSKKNGCFVVLSPNKLIPDDLPRCFPLFLPPIWNMYLPGKHSSGDLCLCF